MYLKGSFLKKKFHHPKITTINMLVIFSRILLF